MKELCRQLADLGMIGSMVPLLLEEGQNDRLVDPDLSKENPGL